VKRKKDVVSPLRIAVLDLPTPVLGCFHLVRYYLNAVEASETLAEDCTDDRFHAAAEVSIITTRESYEFFYLDTITTGISFPSQNS
jgi:hypothetical protein